MEVVEDGSLGRDGGVWLEDEEEWKVGDNLKGVMAETANFYDSDLDRQKKSSRYQNGFLFVSTVDYSCSWLLIA